MDKDKYDGNIPGKIIINGKSVQVLPGQTLTLTDGKGGYKITDTIKCCKK